MRKLASNSDLNLLFYLQPRSSFSAGLTGLVGPLLSFPLLSFRVAKQNGLSSYSCIRRMHIVCAVAPHHTVSFFNNVASSFVVPLLICKNYDGRQEKGRKKEIIIRVECEEFLTRFDWQRHLAADRLFNNNLVISRNGSSNPDYLVVYFLS